MKLKCVEHKKRVHVLESGSTLHREDGSDCHAHFVRIGDRTLRPSEVLRNAHHYPPADYQRDIDYLKRFGTTIEEVSAAFKQLAVKATLAVEPFKIGIQKFNSALPKENHIYKYVEIDEDPGKRLLRKIFEKPADD